MPRRSTRFAFEPAFFLSGRAWDETTEYGMKLPYGESPPNDAAKTLIRDLPLPGTTGKKEFLFLFDFGDNWEFGVKLMRTSQELHPTEAYPRIANSKGEAPPQYPELDDWDEEVEFEVSADGDPDTQR